MVGDWLGKKGWENISNNIHKVTKQRIRITYDLHQTQFQSEDLCGNLWCSSIGSVFRLHFFFVWTTIESVEQSETYNTKMFQNNLNYMSIRMEIKDQSWTLSCLV